MTTAPVLEREGAVREDPQAKTCKHGDTVPINCQAKIISEVSLLFASFLRTRSIAGAVVNTEAQPLIA